MPVASKNYRCASEFVLPFGKHKGRTLDQVAETDKGLLYLDWLNGLENTSGDLKLALETYLADPAIARELHRLLEN